MTAEDQLAGIGSLDAALTAAGIEYWLFGGWAVDFWVGSGTRLHEDIDAIVWRSDYDAVKSALEAAGWEHLPKDSDRLGTTYVLGTAELELTFVEPGENGGVLLPLPEERVVLAQAPFGNARRTLSGVSARVIPLDVLRDGKSRPREHQIDAAKDRADYEALVRRR